MPSWLSEAFQSWHEAKLFVERLTAISHDALHILAGTAIWLAFALVLRRPVTSWLPLGATLIVVLLNEAVDLWVEIWPERAMQAGEASKDILTTVAVPALLCLALRNVPRLTGPGKR
jgi:hypothetical protein